MDGVLQIKLARCTSKSNLYLQPSRPKRRARGPGTVPPLMLRFASCQPACQIRSIRRNNLKREGAHAWIASRNWIEKGKKNTSCLSTSQRQWWIRWPRIQSSWIREVTPADANNAGRGMDAAEASRRRTPWRAAAPDLLRLAERYGRCSSSGCSRGTGSPC